MSELHILDAGRADCTVLLLDTPQGRQTVVVDGGGKYYGARRPLLEFLTQRNISDIDLLILTHLHQDHFGGFVHLVDQVHKAAEVILVQMGQDEQVDIGDISLGEEL